MPYMLIDVTSLAETNIVMVANTHEAPLIAKLFKAKGREIIAPPLEGRGFGKLSTEQMQYLYWNLTQQTPPTEFAELGAALLVIAKQLPVDQTPIATLEAEVARLCPDEPAGEPKAEKKAREPRAAGETPERPKATSTTGLVWELADQQFGILHPSGDASTADWKIIRAGVMDACETEGINSATAATQYSKWKGAKLAAKAA
jgi:hypothetical protein